MCVLCVCALMFYGRSCVCACTCVCVRPSFPSPLVRRDHSSTFQRALPAPPSLSHRIITTKPRLSPHSHTRSPSAASLGLRIASRVVSLAGAAPFLGSVFFDIVGATKNGRINSSEGGVGFLCEIEKQTTNFFFFLFFFGALQAEIPS